ncbi:helix-turn-helix domain-containing protein [uncultured Winogradskyella sp.]|uniref:helix-turn-helix domain-containing protein n=1 Tax=uncultured Winogradskyella sp. TaxID=395353 RepID=UPI00261E8D5D|nr:helix-turn-helix domain-containing protein [uncultured Winogradskyella sp.]
MVRFYKYKHGHPYGDYLQSIWALTNEEGISREPVVSDGFPEILFLIKGSIKIIIGLEKYDISSHAYIGIVDKSSYFELAPNTIILSFKLMPWMTSNIINDEAYYLKNQVVPLSDLNYNKSFNLDEMNCLDSIIYYVLHQELPKIFSKKKNIPSALLFDIFSQFDSLQKLSAPIRKVGSSRYFEKLYRTHVGISPMRYKRLLKIKKSTLILAEHQDVKIEPLALALGYYDLSHFYKDFSVFTNHTPNEFKTNCHQSILLEDNNYIGQYLYS